MQTRRRPQLFVRPAGALSDVPAQLCTAEVLEDRSSGSAGCADSADSVATDALALGWALHKEQGKQQCDDRGNYQQ